MAPSRAGPASSRPLSRTDKICLAWFVLDAITHLSVEAAYVFVTLAYGGARNSSSALAYMWREYGRADSRWSGYDPTVLSLELLTVLGMGPLAVAMIYGIYARRPWRHFAQTVICVCELYGGVMTFVPEWVAGSPSLSSDPFLQFVYLFFFNALWVWVPLVLLYDSAHRIISACDKAKVEGSDETAAGQGAYTFIAVTLVLYALIVPTVLLTSKA